MAFDSALARERLPSAHWRQTSPGHVAGHCDLDRLDWGRAFGARVGVGATRVITRLAGVGVAKGEVAEGIAVAEAVMLGVTVTVTVEGVGAAGDGVSSRRCTRTS